MSTFIHEDFLLRSAIARRLYHEFAETAPIVDYHCHLDPRDLAADRRFENLAQLWVTGDPYKHRLMRLAGVSERVVSGGAPDREKFDCWAATVPKTLGNPLHHWTALELKRYFNLDEPLNMNSSARIWAACNARLAESRFSARGLLAQRGVACVCTSDRLLDDLGPHAAVAREGGAVRVLPSLRADDVVAVESAEFLPWVQALGDATRASIKDFDGFRAAIGRKLDAFAQAGSRLADHGLDDFTYLSVDETETGVLFARRMNGESLAGESLMKLRSGLLRFLGGEYARRGWIMQLHLGAQRRTSSRLRRLAGPAGGYAGIARGTDIGSVAAWLDDLENAGALPRTILYPLNPADFVPFAVLTGSFAEDGVAGKLQLGPAWWFNDHATGMRAQLDAVASHSLLSGFIGMTTDSRSLLSMVRHEYFRRVFCDWLAEQAGAGAMPDQLEELGPLVLAVCGENARRALAL